MCLTFNLYINKIKFIQKLPHFEEEITTVNVKLYYFRVAFPLF